MVVPQCTKPNAVRWVQCDHYELQEALRSMKREGVVFTPSVWDNQTIYTTPTGIIVARRYGYRQNRAQHLLAVQFKSHLPKKLAEFVVFAEAAKEEEAYKNPIEEADEALRMVGAARGQS